MKLVFMGTPGFAVPSLELLASRHDVLAVVTAPDRPAGRGKKIRESEVKKAALKLGLPVLQPTNLKDSEFVNHLAELQADLFVVVAFRMLPEQVWQLPGKGTINLHASLLPQYRGAAPINRAIMAGEKTTGLTTFFIEKEIDTGMILEQVEMEIGVDEDAGSLHDRMMMKGANLLLSTVNKISQNAIKPKKQMDSPDLKPAHKIFRDDCKIDWNRSEEEIFNHIRGLSPYPGAWTIATGDNYREEPFKILKSRRADFLIAGSPGSILLTDDKRLFVKSGKGNLEILKLQAPGKKPMSTADFLRGFLPPIDFRFI